MERGREEPSGVVAAVVGGGSSARGGSPARAMVAAVAARGAPTVPGTDLVEMSPIVASGVMAAAPDVMAASSDVVDAGEGGSGGGNGAPALEEPTLPYWVSYYEEPPFEEYVSDELPEEDDEDVDNSIESRDAKSRHVLRHLIAGYPCCERRDGSCKKCPFCTRIVQIDRNSVIQHTVNIGCSSNAQLPPAFKAKHAAIGVYLKKQRAWDYSTGKELPPLKLRIEKMKEAAANGY